MCHLHQHHNFKDDLYRAYPPAAEALFWFNLIDDNIRSTHLLTTFVPAGPKVVNPHSPTNQAFANIRQILLTKSEAAGPIVVKQSPRATYITSVTSTTYITYSTSITYITSATYITLNMNRPNWDEYFMELAQVVAKRGTCDRARVGALIVKDNRIIATGYNGSPPGMEHCDDVGHLMIDGHCLRTLHAEENVILQAAVVGGVSTKGATLYTTHSTCYPCLKRAIAVGVKRIVAGKIYRDPSVHDTCETVGIDFVVMPPAAKETIDELIMEDAAAATS